MVSVLKEIGLTPIVPESGYFMLVDTAPLGGYISAAVYEVQSAFVA